MLYDSTQLTRTLYYQPCFFDRTFPYFSTFISIAYSRATCNFDHPKKAITFSNSHFIFYVNSVPLFYFPQLRYIIKICKLDRTRFLLVLLLARVMHTTNPIKAYLNWHLIHVMIRTV